MTTEQRPIGEAPPPPARRPDPEFLAAVGALGRVARALVGRGSLGELAERALDEMRVALGLELVVLYLPRLAEQASLQRYVTSAEERATTRARDEIEFDDEAWRLAIASGAPLVFREEASWLVSNPFAPPAQAWLVLPLVSETRLVGVVVACARPTWSLCPTAATVLTLLGDLLAAGISTARLRQQLQGAEIERERARLAAEIHDGLAQDLALAMRELALLESEPPPELARASAERLREAISSARRVVRARLEDLSIHIPLGGVQAAVEEISARRGAGLPLRVRCEGPAVDVSPETTAVVVRVLTEALANSARHAQPERAEVRLLVEDERLTLEIEDDGVGFRPAEAGGPGDGHFGLTLMRERARSLGGRLSVRSAPGEGTCVTLEVPV
ncbi:MAG: GAF domain-containing sensor histidine kinase [Thermoleophilaceae bacterium]